jgi:phage-related protein
MEITEDKLKEILTEQRQTFQHFTGIIKEDTNAKFQIIGEQFQGIKDTLGALMEDVSIIKTDVQSLKSSLKKKVDYDEFEELIKRVSLLESKVRR